MHGVVFTGRRYDTGDRLDYLKTVVRLAAEREDLGPDFRVLAARVRGRPAGQGAATQPVDLADQIEKADQTEREVAR